MALRPCLDCGTLTDGSRCPRHQADKDNARYARRGTTAQRGLSGAHARMSQLYKDTNRACAICHRHGTPGNPITAGHIIPRSRGGTNDPSNYQPECLSCNSAKQHHTEPPMPG